MTLTPRQRTVARLITQAATNKQIAATVGVQEGRVEQIVTEIAREWGLTRRKNIRVQIALEYQRRYGVDDLTA